MKLTINRDDLLPLLERAMLVVERKSTIPILNYAKLELSEGALTITATDMDLWLRQSCSVSGNELSDGTCLLPLGKLLEAVRNCSQEIKIDSGVVSSGPYRVKLPTEELKNYPAIPDQDGELHLVSGALLSKALKMVSPFANQKDDSKYAITGVKVEMNGSGFRAIGMDGKRMAVFSTLPEPSADKVINIIFPNRTVTAIKALLTDAEVEVKLGSVATIRSGNWQLRSRLMSGQFPNWQLIMPKDFPGSVKFQKQALLDSVNRVALAAAGEDRLVRYDIEDGLVKISGNWDNCEAYDSFAAEQAGQPLRFKLQISYPAVALKNLGSDDVALIYKDGESQLEISEATDTYSLRQIMMPWRIK